MNMSQSQATRLALFIFTAYYSAKQYLNSMLMNQIVDQIVEYPNNHFGTIKPMKFCFSDT